MMDFSYKKNDNKDLFKNFTQDRFLNLENPQNYIPLYSMFFTLNETNFNNINLYNNNYLSAVHSKLSNNIFNCSIIDKTNGIKEKKVFFKYSPLLDPTKYIIGKYDLDDKLLNLPKLNNVKSYPKTRDPNNSSYVDSFFTYLTSRLLNTFNFIHGVDFYGSYIAHKHNFQFNIADDIEYLNDSEFFHKNRGILFEVDNNYACSVFDFNTRTNKQKLQFDNVSITTDLEISDIQELNILDNIFKKEQFIQQDNNINLVFNYDLSLNSSTRKSNSSSECSSRSSLTNDSETETETETDLDLECSETNNEERKEKINKKNIYDHSDGDGDDNKTISDGEHSCISNYTTATEDVVYATIPIFPVQVIAMENCHATLDSLIVNNKEELTYKEWESIVIQILMMLITYQKVFSLTHNDLHTNNIMYNITDKQFLYYKIEDKYYKVPTFGKIFKIIDFGRAIYKFRGNSICSDSFHCKGDAATQYNFEPYFNKNKPRLEPNYSFDLCRLGCSLYDFISDELNEKRPNSGILHIISDWCKDDKGRNVLYKTNGEERYPDFKLYKMIARTVHNHIPINVLKNHIFDKYSIGKKKITKNTKIINIDSLPVLT